MWILLAAVSALLLGFYDIFKKLSVRANNVPVVLWLNTLFGSLLLSPVILQSLTGNQDVLPVVGHAHIMLKALIVLGSWILGYFAIKHLPLTIQGPVNATRPVLVLIGALLIFGERLNLWQWAGVLLGILSLYMISRIGANEGFSLRHSRWLWMSIGATVLGAISALYDKYLIHLYQPLQVQAWYSLYQCVIMGGVTIVLLRTSALRAKAGKFTWRWSIPCIALFLTAADMAYFYALSLPDAMIAIVSMMRRGSVLVSFAYGVLALHERGIRTKLVDLGILLLGLACLTIGSL
ncbi:MAG: DMT family transporter [Paramuribaculum sp.]|nr:DMT family transporter [Paramuribaculum sp.]